MISTAGGAVKTIGKNIEGAAKEGKKAVEQIGKELEGILGGGKKK